MTVRDILFTSIDPGKYWMTKFNIKTTYDQWYGNGAMFMDNSNNTYVLYITPTNEVNFTKLNPNGYVEWADKINFGATPGNYIDCRNVVFDGTDSVYIVASHSSGLNIIKYSISSRSITAKTRFAGSGIDSNYSVYPGSVTYYSNNIYIVAWGYNSSSQQIGYAIKFNTSLTLVTQFYYGGSISSYNYRATSSSCWVGGYLWLAFLRDNISTGDQDVQWSKLTTSFSNQTSDAYAYTYVDGTGYNRPYSVQPSMYSTNLTAIGNQGTGQDSSAIMTLNYYNQNGTIFKRVAFGDPNNYTNIPSLCLSDDATDYVYTGRHIMKIVGTTDTLSWQRSILVAGGELSGPAYGQRAIIKSGVITIIGSNSTGLYVIKLPSDGSLTGTYNGPAGQLSYTPSTVSVWTPTVNSRTNSGGTTGVTISTGSSTANVTPTTVFSPITDIPPN